MNYSEALEKLFALPMFQHVGSKAYIPSLDNIRELSALLGHPERKFAAIHVAGTNGKGSTSHMLASILQEAGFRTGLYTSPHLLDYRERVRIDGAMVGEGTVVSFVERTADFFASRPVSFFEATTALAFYAFAEANVGIAVIETGLGGLYDSTNILQPVLSVITNISYDHRNILGDTLEAIAFQKGGIIKPGVPALVGEHRPETDGVFRRLADERQSPLVFAEDRVRVVREDERTFRAETTGKTAFYPCDLTGDYQAKNIATVLAAVSLLPRTYAVSPENVSRGIAHAAANTGLRGRWQRLGSDPLILCDTGHNEGGIRFITGQLDRIPHRKLLFVLGFMADKELETILPLFPKTADYFFCQTAGERAMPAPELQRKAAEYGLKGRAFGTAKGASSVAEAVEAARRAARKEDVVFIGGSTFVVADSLSEK